MITQIVILCGGRGSRLGKITEATAKPMLKFAGEPFLTHLIKKYSRYPIDEILLLSGYQGDEIYAQYSDKVFNGVNIKVIVEPNPLGTLGAVLGSFKFLASEFLLTNGDSYVEYDFWKFAKWWQLVNCDYSCAIGVGSVLDTSRYGQVRVSGNTVINLAEKEEEGSEGLINLGMYILKKDTLEKYLVDQYSVSSLEKDLLPNLVSDRSLIHFKIDNHSLIDFGIPEDLQKLKSHLSEKPRERAIFLDRDNTINYDTGYTYKVDDLILCDRIPEIIKSYTEQGYKAFIVSNQSGIGRGYYSEEAVQRFHKELKIKLSQFDIFIDDFRFCPHHPVAGIGNYRKACNCRKPQPGMVFDLTKSWNLDLSASIFIGDSEADRLCAQRSGLDFMQVKCQISG